MPMRLGHAETYDVAIHFKGGQHMWVAPPQFSSLTWGRKLDDFSEASVTIPKTSTAVSMDDPTIDPMDWRLGNTHCWGHELTVHRDGQMVWQGPIIGKSEFRDRFEFQARDMLAWFDRKVNTRLYNYAPYEYQKNPGGNGKKDPGELISALIWDGFSLKTLPQQQDPNQPKPQPVGGIAWHDPNLMAFLDVRAYNVNPSAPSAFKIEWQQLSLWSKTVGEMIRDVLTHGMDMFTVGRNIFIWPERISRANVPHRLTEEDFLGDLEVRELGLDAATRGVCIGSTFVGAYDSGAGVPVTYPPPRPPVAQWPIAGDNAAFDDFYGHLERITTSESATDRESVLNIAKWFRQSNWPMPVVVVVGENTQLSPDAPITIDELIPARRIGVHLGDAAFHQQARGDFILNELEVEVNNVGSAMSEQVHVSLASVNAS